MIKVEIIEFYPLDRNEERGLLTGTLRIKLPDLGIHILGVYVSKRKCSWYFSLPGGKGIDHETRKTVRFPSFVFEDFEKQRELMNVIREKGLEFIKKRLSDKKTLLISPSEEE